MIYGLSFLTQEKKKSLPMLIRELSSCKSTNFSCLVILQLNDIYL